MRKYLAVLLYGVAAYVVFLAAFLFAIGFVGNLIVPKGIDAGTAGDTIEAVAVTAFLFGFYAFVRHPIVLGFIVAFCAAPSMMLGHLVFAVATTACILIDRQLEERDLVAAVGQAYSDYRTRVPMLVLWPKAKSGE